MDTRWKNRLQILGLLLLLTFGLKGIFSGYSLLTTGNDYLKGNYFQTSKFENELNEFIEYLTWFELGITKEAAKSTITVSSSEIEEHRFRHGNLADQIESITLQYENRIQNALAEKNQEIADLYIGERDLLIEDITKNFKDDEHVRAKIIKEKEQLIDEHYANLENYRPLFLRYKEMYSYYFQDSETGNVYTNIKLNHDETVNELMNDKQMLFFRSYSFGFSMLNDYSNRHGYPEEIAHIYQLQKDKVYTGHIGVAKTLPASSSIIINYNNHKKSQMFLLIYTVVSLLALGLSLYFYKKTSIIQSFSMEKWLPYFERIPLDVRVFTILVTSMITLALLTSSSIHQFFYYNNIFYVIEDLVFVSMISAVFLFITYVQGKFLFAKIKDIASFTEEWKKSVVYSVYRYSCKMIHELFLIRSIATQLIILLGIVASAFIVVLFVALVEPYIIAPFIFFLFMICCLVLLFIVVRTAYFNKIVTNVDELVKGNLHADLPVKGKSVLAKLAGNINTLKHGVQLSQKEQAKSERLKTELITNVSHDLRTPLTSIITYTELLKGPDVSAQDRHSYLEIIDRKSKRLKILIDDLFEVSKMASGNMEIMKEKVDIVQLLQQSLAEYNETINQSTLKFRVTKPETPILVDVDGQKMWRVFENLIGNILKYSLEQTRVYISVHTIQDSAVITFKNVTKYELGENVDELFERFKRGDTSRFTDGSGLGLAIAKSIVDLHQGQLDIELDGDLFKVTIKISLSRQ